MSDEPIKFSFVESGLDAIQNNLRSVKGVIAGIATATTFKKMISEAAEADDNVRKLSFAMQSAQTYSEKAVRSFEEFASKMQMTTRFSNNATIAVATLFRNITSLSNNQIKAAIDRTADLAIVLGVDLETAGRKVINVLEGNVSALSRYGIKVKDGSNEQERLNNLLDATGKIAGSAANDLSTFAGTMKSVENQVSNLYETFGKVIIRSTLFKNVLETITDNLSYFATGVDGISKGIDYLFQKKSDKDELTGRIKDLNEELSKLENKSDTAKRIEERLGISSVPRIQELKKEIASLQILLDAKKISKPETIQKAEDVDNKKGIAIADNTKLYDEQLKKILDVQNAVQNAGLTEIQVLEKTRNERLKAFKEGEDQLLIKGGATLAEVNQIKLNIETDFQSKMSEIRKKADKEKFDSQTKEVVEANTFNRKKLLNASLNSAKQGSIEYAANEQRLSNLSDTFDTMASLTNSGNRTLFEIGKAASISTATVDGIVGVQKAFASAPPPFGAILAGIIGVATAANIAKIVSTPFGGTSGSANTGTGATGTGAPAVTVSGNLGGLRPMATGGLVPQGFNSDNFPARLNSGEFVLNTSLAKKLDKFLEDKTQKENSSKMQEQFNKIMNTGVTQSFNYIQNYVDKVKNIASKYNTAAFGSIGGNLDYSKFSDIQKLATIASGVSGFGAPSYDTRVKTWQGSTAEGRAGLLANQGISGAQANSDYQNLNYLMQQIVNEGNKPVVVQSAVQVNGATFANINLQIEKNGNRAGGYKKKG